MSKIVIVTSSVAGANFSFHSGQSVEMPEPMATSWIEHGIAIEAPEGTVPAASLCMRVAPADETTEPSKPETSQPETPNSKTSNTKK
ncbi:MAG: hypothetical protein JXR39_11545 [Marinilabiliaceae bacterium]|nr:hypothetical protein [Marinilabiliaceae bacterium]